MKSERRRRARHSPLRQRHWRLRNRDGVVNTGGSQNGDDSSPAATEEESPQGNTLHARVAARAEQQADETLLDHSAEEYEEGRIQAAQPRLKFQETGSLADDRPFTSWERRHEG